MKKVIITTITVASIIASTITSRAADLYDKCEDMGKVATAVMERRQAGISMDRLLSIAENTGDSGVIRHIIIAAYRRPIEDTNYDKSTAVERFHNEVFLSCIRLVKSVE